MAQFQAVPHHCRWFTKWPSAVIIIFPLVYKLQLFWDREVEKQTDLWRPQMASVWAHYNLCLMMHTQNFGREDRSTARNRTEKRHKTTSWQQQQNICIQSAVPFICSWTTFLFFYIFRSVLNCGGGVGTWSPVTQKTNLHTFLRSPRWITRDFDQFSLFGFTGTREIFLYEQQRSLFVCHCWHSPWGCSL